MGTNCEVIVFPPGKPGKISKWKVKVGTFVSIGRVLLLYDVNSSNGQEELKKLKATQMGMVRKLLAREGQTITPGTALLELEECTHPTVMNAMCAECGADLKTENQNCLKASVPMVHSIPELKVSREQAELIGKADEERLLKHRKLVLLVDLDQTLIHTTNDNIPPNIKDVYHFQLYGPTSPWYHTRIRPGTRHFLKEMSQMYELHICTFGARNYAHMIATFLDPDGKYFSHRILSRDECFNSSSKTANLSALFPCGDNMVCIIDDREDVWNFAPNLIHVKPYHFFRHTGDINAPPGLTKHENDEKEGFDFSSFDNRSSEKRIPEKTKEMELVPEVELVPEKTTKMELVPEKTKKMELVPEKTKKVELKPEETKKVELKPEETKKVELVPEETKKVELVPEETKEMELVPEKTKEMELVPDKTKKVELVPEETKKVELVPEETKKVELVPEETKKVELVPEETKEMELVPEETKEMELVPEETKEMELVQENTKDMELVPEKTKKVELVPEERKQIEFDKKPNLENEKNLAKEKIEEKEISVKDALMNDDKLESQISNNEIKLREGKLAGGIELKKNDPERQKMNNEKQIKSKESENSSVKNTGALAMQYHTVGEKDSDVHYSTCNSNENSESARAVKENRKVGSKKKSSANIKENCELVSKVKESENFIDVRDAMLEVLAKGVVSNNISEIEKEVEDSDDYLLYLEGILKTIHHAFYELYDELQGDIPDLKSVIPYVRRKVLTGTRLVFSGLVPTNVPLEKSRVYQVARSLGAVVSSDIDSKTTHLVAIRSGTAKVNTARRMKNIAIVTPEWLWGCAERWEHIEEKLFPLGRGQTSSRHPPPHCGSPDHTPGQLLAASRFMDSINPLMSFSSEDIEKMDQEVEDIFNESESEGEHEESKGRCPAKSVVEKVEEEEEDEEEEENREDEAAVRRAVLEYDSSSSSADSLSGEHPHGWRSSESGRRKRTVTDSEVDDFDEDMPSTKFRRGEALPSDLELGEDDSASNGSDEPPDEIDDGDWNMMGAALEREFLSGDRD